MDKSQIKKQSKQLLDRFAKSLEDIEKNTKTEFHLEREKFEREEKPKNSNKDNKESQEFKKRILDNAPNSNEDFILTEKGSWK